MIVSPFTYIATTDAILLCYALPVSVDSDLKTFDSVEKVGLEEGCGNFNDFTRGNCGYSVVRFFLLVLIDLALADPPVISLTVQVVQTASSGSR